MSEKDLNQSSRRPSSWIRVLVYGLLPGVALLLAMGSGFLKFRDASARSAEVSRVESVQAASQGTIKMLTYRPDTVEQELDAARDLMTGALWDSYGSFTHDVVMPGAKEKKISAVATVPAAASVSAGSNHAVVLVFVNQTTTVGAESPTNLASSVRVSLEKVNGRWLMSAFDPI
nr:hypothetical protein [Mycolicibacter sinensis]